MLMFITASVLLGSVRPESMESAAEGLQVLHCPPCERIHCTPRRALKLQCRGGVTTGICGCCPVCARTAGESCGGRWDYLGKCDAGLVCEDRQPWDDQEHGGICRAVLESTDLDNCRPECTRAYCQANHNEICSARSASLNKKDCHGSCQHTSCSSCLILKTPSCPQACGPSDPSCLHRFGRCVHNRLSLPHRGLLDQDLESNADGVFLCFLPNCPNTPN
ncbi:hypothetical protein NHX12_002311 [Muraenolepis orangiensis]|uniref:IGFBP N-terminal domain-containing protein n=1 Tax=Muraenolepis orangiensis TaxID=630683 RepID=A0A9Q0IEM8_9TELE|nr:hypothetical protein NHX12_002311 [Muraenolepis orangiensis]